MCLVIFILTKVYMRIDWTYYNIMQHGFSKFISIYLILLRFYKLNLRLEKIKQFTYTKNAKMLRGTLKIHSKSLKYCENTYLLKF